MLNVVRAMPSLSTFRKREEDETLYSRDTAEISSEFPSQQTSEKINGHFSLGNVQVLVNTFNLQGENKGLFVLLSRTQAEE